MRTVFIGPALLLAVGLPSCSGGDGAAGAPGASALVDGVPEPAGAHCDTGGTALRVGVDGNGNHVLDEDEVQSTQYVCNGSPGTGKRGLVSVEQEPPGKNCASGGQAIHTGTDDDDDGILEANEIDSTVYACNGASGVASLVRQEDEPAGANCPNGGVALLSGEDADDDGFLDDPEVTTTSYVCNGSPGAPAVSSLVFVSAEAAGNNCAAGGQRIDVGLDQNGNGSLDPNEITNTTYVCDGADGADGSHFVTSVENAAWGGVCTFGGVRIATGADADDDGVLDAAEVGDVQYVCNVVPSVIAAGGSATCVVMSDSSVRCAGSNNHGQLGLGTVAQLETVFRAVPGYGDETGLAPVINAAPGFAHTCFLLASGTVQCAGDNAHGQLGNGTFNESHTPVTVAGLANVTQISGSFNSTCALSGGHVYCWGQNNHGQLGNGSTLDRSTPAQVIGLSNAFAISVGAYHACALTGTGQAYCWGLNGSGQLGDNTTTEHHTAFGVSGLSTGMKIAVGTQHTCAIVKGGSVYCWGANNFGQLGDGTITDHHFPHALGAYPPNAVDIGLADIDSCARYANGSVYCWGGSVVADSSMTPLQVAGWNWTSLSTGLGYGCGLRGNREAWCWGDNGAGQFGTLNLTASFDPVHIDLAPAP